jgi:GNAT superfamily N-acetyltransferase
MNNDHDDRSITIRLASQGDAEQLAHGCEQLGYPVAIEHLSFRLTPLLLQSEHAPFVAERPDGHLLGWVHVYRCFLVHTDPEAQIGELVVDAAVHRSGVGNCLMQAAEQWAREQGCWAIYLRSRVSRADAHQFYRKIGYEVVTSSVFYKLL